MGSKGLKAIIIDPGKTGPVETADPEAFRRLVKSWVNTLKHDVSCSLYSRFGTPFAVSNSASQGTLPTLNYRSGRPEDFIAVSGNSIQKILFERGGRMHGCMPGCVVRCSIIYPDQEGQRLCSAYEYETIALLGTNLGIIDPDAIARLKFLCDDLGVDAIETGSALGLAAEAGKMTFGDWSSAARLLEEMERETPLGRALGNGVVATARYLGVSRVPAYKGQALPGHDPRSTKGTGVTYQTSPMGADHTAGLTYRIPRSRTKQAENSLKAQIQAAVCDAFGYCLNAVPGGRVSLYPFLAGLLNARYGGRWTAEDVLEIGKQTLRDQLAFNEKAEFSRGDIREAAFIREEAIAPTHQVFDVEEAEITHFWAGLDSFQEKEKIWEIRIPPLPETLFGAGVAGKMGEALQRLKVKKLFIVTDPVMFSLGRADEIRRIVEPRGLETVVFSEVEPDPPIELIERAGRLYTESGCDGILGLGGGSSMDTAKALGLRVTHPGDLREFEGIVGGGGKIKPILPPIVCLPTTSGTGSEVNPCAVITDQGAGPETGFDEQSPDPPDGGHRSPVLPEHAARPDHRLRRRRPGPLHRGLCFPGHPLPSLFRVHGGLRGKTDRAQPPPGLSGRGGYRRPDRHVHGGPLRRPGLPERPGGRPCPDPRAGRPLPSAPRPGGHLRAPVLCPSQPGNL